MKRPLRKLIQVGLNCILLLSLSCFFSCKIRTDSKVSSEGDLPFKHQIIDSLGPKNPWAKILADINLDGRLDVIIGGQKGPMVGYLYPDWNRITIIGGGYDTVDGEAGDVDGDGDNDIVMGGIFWYENPGAESILFSKSWETHQIADHATHDVELGDVDRDGKLDVVTRNQSEFGALAGNRIHVWIQQDQVWENQVIECPQGEGIDLEDIDGDSDLDIVIGGIWYENPQWIGHRYADWYPNASIKVADINKDGRQDIVLTPSELKDGTYRISWFEQPEVESDSWPEHLVQDSTETIVHGIQVDDMNNDGWPDIIAAEMHQGKDPDEVMVFINLGEGTGWKKELIDINGSHLVQVGDIDSDGDIDIMGANWSGAYQPVEVWINQLVN